MKPLIYFLILIVSLAFSNDVQASGNTLLKACTHAENYFKDESKFDYDNVGSASLCIGMLRGFRDGVDIGHVIYAKNEEEEKGICFPEEMGIEQMNLVLLKYLRSTPEILHEDNWLVLYKAMAPFHCKEQDNK